MPASDKAGAKGGARGRKSRQPRQKRNLIGTEDEVVAATQAHAEQVHNMKATREDVLARMETVES